MLGLGFKRSKEDHYVYFKLIGDHLIYFVLYMDDKLLIGNNKEIIQGVKTQLSSKFDMKDLGSVNFILGMKIKRDWENKKLWLNKKNVSRQYCRGLICRNVNRSRFLFLLV